MISQLLTISPLLPWVLSLCIKPESRETLQLFKEIYMIFALAKFLISLILFFLMFLFSRRGGIEVQMLSNSWYWLFSHILIGFTMIEWLVNYGNSTNMIRLYVQRLEGLRIVFITYLFTYSVQSFVQLIREELKNMNILAEFSRLRIWWKAFDSPWPSPLPLIVGKYIGPG